MCSPDEVHWDAHCMDCDNTIYWYGNPEPMYAASGPQAVAVWNWLNKERE